MIQPNSLVVIKKLPSMYYVFSSWMPNDNESDIYTISAIGRDQYDEEDMVILEEGCMGYREGSEIGIPIEFVREVQPPEAISVQDIVEEAIHAFV